MIFIISVTYFDPPALTNFSRDESLVSDAIPLNEQLERVLAKHDALISGRLSNPACASSPDETGKREINYDDEEEEEQLLRRYL